jgi:hypothetical protein
LKTALPKFDVSWFVPALWRYRHLLRDVLIASFVLQIFALATPIFLSRAGDLAPRGLGGAGGDSPSGASSGPMDADGPRRSSLVALACFTLNGAIVAGHRSGLLPPAAAPLSADSCRRYANAFDPLFEAGHSRHATPSPNSWRTAGSLPHKPEISGPKPAEPQSLGIVSKCL